MSNKARMITAPSQVFSSVEELLDSSALTREEKLTALSNWKQMTELQRASTHEGMQGETPSAPYASILAAIRKLTEDSEN